MTVAIPAPKVAEKPPTRPTPPPVRPPTPPRDPRNPTPSPTGPTKLPPGPPPRSYAFLPKLPTPPIPRLKIGRVFATWPWMLRPGDKVVEFDAAHRKVEAIFEVTKVERPSAGRGCSQGGTHINNACYSRHLPVFYVPRKEENGEPDSTGV